jgi:hypothetical protein
VRLFLEIVIIGALVYLGWEIPFKQRVDEITGKQTTTATSSPAVAPALPVASGI